MTSLCMTASPRCCNRSYRPRYDPTRTRKIKRFLQVDGSDVCVGSPETVWVPDPFSPHRHRLQQLRMEGEAATPRAAFRARGPGNVDSNQRSCVLGRWLTPQR